MFNFFKKLLGLPTAAEKEAAKPTAQAPYKIEKTEDQFPAVKQPIDGGNRAFKPKAPKNAAGKPKVNKPKAKKAK